MMRDSPEIARAFCGASPHGRMMRSISGSGIRAIVPGERALANRAGVISLTRLSVHCADSTTATSSVNASSCCSGTGGLGYNSASLLATKAARLALVFSDNGRGSGAGGDSEGKDVFSVMPNHNSRRAPACE